jgi:hypothetical protein
MGAQPHGEISRFPQRVAGIGNRARERIQEHRLVVPSLCISAAS